MEPTIAGSRPAPPIPRPPPRVPVRRPPPPRPPVTRLKTRTHWRRLIPSDTNIYLLLFVLVAVLVMAWGYLASLRSVVVIIGDKDLTLLTRQTTVRGALTEAGINWNTKDILQPNLDEPILPDGRIVFRATVPVVVEADGDQIERLTQSATVEGVLEESGVQLKPSDRVYLDGRIVNLNSKLPRAWASEGGVSIPASEPQPAHLLVERALPISLNDNGLVSTIFTTAPTLGTALRESGVLVYLGDYVSPDLGSPVASGESVFIRRSRGIHYRGWARDQNPNPRFKCGGAFGARGDTTRR